MDDEFSRTLGKPIVDYVGAYLHVFTNYDLHQQQRKNYFHQLFRGEERRFYRLKKSENSTFQDDVATMQQ